MKTKLKIMIVVVCALLLISVGCTSNNNKNKKDKNEPETYTVDEFIEYVSTENFQSYIENVTQTNCLVYGEVTWILETYNKFALESFEFYYPYNSRMILEVGDFITINILIVNTNNITHMICTDIYW